MKNNKNKKNLVTLWTYECIWIDVEVDSQYQTELKGSQKKRELHVYRRVKWQYLQNGQYELVEQIVKVMGVRI